jgi:hypothetical protein
VGCNFDARRVHVWRTCTTPLGTSLRRWARTCGHYLARTCGHVWAHLGGHLWAYRVHVYCTCTHSWSVPDYVTHLWGAHVWAGSHGLKMRTSFARGAHVWAYGRVWVLGMRGHWSRMGIGHVWAHIWGAYWARGRASGACILDAYVCHILPRCPKQPLNSSEEMVVSEGAHVQQR